MRPAFLLRILLVAVVIAAASAADIATSTTISCPGSGVSGTPLTCTSSTNGIAAADSSTWVEYGFTTIVGMPTTCGDNANGVFVQGTGGSPVTSSCNATFTAAGQFDVTATYRGQTGYTRSVSSSVRIKVTSGSKLDLSFTTGTPYVTLRGKNQTFTATVTESPAPAGTSFYADFTGQYVRFAFDASPSDGSITPPTQCYESQNGSLVVPYTAKGALCTVNFGSAWKYSISATWPGNTYFTGSTGNLPKLWSVVHESFVYFVQNPSMAKVGLPQNFTIFVNHSGPSTSDFALTDTTAVVWYTSKSGLIDITAAQLTCSNSPASDKVAAYNNGDIAYASCMASFSSIGTFYLVAVVSPDTLLNYSVAASPAAVVKYDSNISFADFPSSDAAVNNITKIAVSLATTPSSATTPTGAVTFEFIPEAGSPAGPVKCEGDSDLTVTPTAGVARCDVNFTDIGNYTVKVTLAGDSNTLAATLISSVLLVKYQPLVSADTNGTTDSGSGSTLAPGDAVALNVSLVTPGKKRAGNVPTGTGTFSFNPSAGAPTACSGHAGLTVTLVKGIATCVVTFPNTGTFVPSMAYSGDYNNAAFTYYLSAVTVGSPTTATTTTKTTTPSGTTTPATATTKPSITNAPSSSGRIAVKYSLAAVALFLCMLSTL